MAGTFRIGAHEIGDHTPCYVIAEIGHNHQGSLEKARELFREAKLAGAHAVKLQKRDNRGLYTRAAYDKPYDNENSFGATYGEHREFLEFGVDEYRELQALRAASSASTSSPPPSTSPAPTSSASSTCRPSRSRRATSRARRCSSTSRAFGKPMIISTGGAAARGRAARLRHDHADQPAARRSCSARPGYPGGVRGARPARHRAPTASVSRTR